MISKILYHDNHDSESYIPIIYIIAISAELTVTVLRTSIEIVNIVQSISLMLQILDVIEQKTL